MGLLAWVIMGLAIWHFTIWIPDRFWGGIVGAFVGALLGSFLFGLAINGLSIPGQSQTHLATAADALGPLVGEPLGVGGDGHHLVR